MLALQPATSEKDPRLQTDVTVGSLFLRSFFVGTFTFADIYSEVGKLYICSSEAIISALEMEIVKSRRCLTKLILIYWRLEDNLVQI